MISNQILCQHKPNSKSMMLSGLLLLIAFILLAQSVNANWHDGFKANGFRGDDANHMRNVQDRPTLREKFDPLIFTSSPGANTYYQPLTYVIFTEIYKRSRGLTYGFKISNHVIHFLNGCLIFLIFTKFVRYPLVACSAALVFLFHPATVAIANWSAGGIEYGFTIYFLLFSMLLLLISYETKRRSAYVFSLFFCLLAFLTKPTVYFYPAVVFLLLLALNPEAHINRPKEIWKHLKTALWQSIPFFILLMPFVWIQVLKYPYGKIAHGWGGVSVGIHTFIRALDLLSGMFTWSRSPEVRGFIMQLVLFVGILFVAWVLVKSKKLHLFASVWITLSLLNVSLANFRPAALVPRYHYIPLIGLLLILTLIIDRLCTLAVPNSNPARSVT